MKKYSDIFSGISTAASRAGRSFATLAMLLFAGIASSYAQDFTFIEGSIHSFSVEFHEGNTFAWSYHDAQFNPMPVEAIDYLEGQFETDVTVRFGDMSRAVSQLTFLAVTETNTHGCSTVRAVSILIEPNNMYFDFAMLPNADDCFNYDNNYMAEVQVGMNFKDRNGETDRAIPESRFPLMVSYTVENKTDGLAAVLGNGGAPLQIDYSETNTYVLLVTEAKGELHRTVEYELAITDVVDRFGTHITHDENRKVQIRIMNHLPNTGGLDMTMAYVLTPINYTGGM